MLEEGPTWGTVESGIRSGVVEKDADVFYEV